MGGLSFIIYNENFKSYNIDFTNGFLKMKNRGPDNTSYLIEQSQNINSNRISYEMLRSNLSRSELAQYSMHTFIYNYHQLCVNDKTIDAYQPYEDPILHKIKKYPDLRIRPKRKLLCDGEIYNYSNLKNEEKFTDKDLQCDSDVEIILPLYIKYGIEKTLNLLNGEFSFVLTENTNTYVLSSIQIFCARDRYGVKPLWYISTNDSTFYMFTSDINSVPDIITKQTSIYTIKEVPPGTYWSFQTKDFKSYIDNTSLTKTIINKTDPDTLQEIYTNIHSKLTEACFIRLYNKGSCGILLDSSDYNSCLLTSILLSQFCLINTSNTIHIFILNKNFNTVLIKFFENTYKLLNIIYHHIYSNTDTYNNLLNDNNSAKSIKSVNSMSSLPSISSVTSLKSNFSYSYSLLENKDLTDLYSYIKKSNIDIKVLYSGYGLNKIWGNLPFTNLSKYEYESGLNGFEMRFPYLDYHFIDYMSYIDDSLKEKRSLNSTTKIVDKYIIRKSFETYLPFDITWN